MLAGCDGKVDTNPPPGGKSHAAKKSLPTPLSTGFGEEPKILSSISQIAPGIGAISILSATPIVAGLPPPRHNFPRSVGGPVQQHSDQALGNENLRPFVEGKVQGNQDRNSLEARADSIREVCFKSPWHSPASAADPPQFC